MSARTGTIAGSIPTTRHPAIPTRRWDLPIATFARSSGGVDDLTVSVDSSFPKGLAFRDWLVNVKASTKAGELDLMKVEHSVDAVDPTFARRWIYGTDPDGKVGSSRVPDMVRYFSFTTPVRYPRCRRMVFLTCTSHSVAATMPTRPSPTAAARVPMASCRHKKRRFRVHDLRPVFLHSKEDGEVPHANRRQIASKNSTVRAVPAHLRSPDSSTRLLAKRDGWRDARLVLGFLGCVTWRSRFFWRSRPSGLRCLGSTCGTCSEKGTACRSGSSASVDAQRLRKINDYTSERARFGLVQSVASTAVTGVFLFAGGLGFYDAWVARWSSSFVVSGVVFFAGLLLASALLAVPFPTFMATSASSSAMKTNRLKHRVCGGATGRRAPCCRCCSPARSRPVRSRWCKQLLTRGGFG